MEIYLVGGAVRDMLLGLETTDKDYVVVDSSEEELLSLGYTKVGKGFPVFLHPTTKEEYALARSETKVSSGYLGFKTSTSGVTLLEDLMRRDITINSIAMDDRGNIIDPTNGQEDLQLGIIRHTSPAFIEDPLRVLRVARFGARFKPYGFKVAHSTHALMRYIVESGELSSLPGERIFTELHKALTYTHSSAFFKILLACGAYNTLFGTNDTSDAHSNSFTHLDGSQPAIIKFALWLQNYDLTTISNIIKILKVPNKYRSLTLLTHTHTVTLEHFNTLSAEDQLTFFIQSDSLRNTEQFMQLLSVCECIGIEVEDIRTMHKRLQSVQFDTTAENGIALLKQQRLQVLQHTSN